MKPEFVIDAHVIGGKHQGTQSVLVCLLRAVADLGMANRFSLLCHDPKQCQDIIEREGFGYETLVNRGAYHRLLLDIPKKLRMTAPKFGIFQYISPPLSRTKSVIFIHDILPLTHPFLFPRLYALRCKFLYSASIASASKVIAVSNQGSEQISRIFPKAFSKISVIRNGPSFDIAEYRLDQIPSPQANQKPYILAVGRIERRKNIELLVKAFLEADLGDIDLRLIGQLDMNYDYEIPKHPRIIVTAHASNNELIEFYRKASLFVYPSSAEGFGLPLLDAILFGLPVISSDQTSMPEVAGELAQFFNPNAIGAQTLLAEKLRKHFKSAPISPPTIEQRKSHASIFSWAKAAKQLVELLDNAATESSGQTI